MQPRVSILMPFRSAEATIDACLASILGQSFSDWELIAVDDRSDSSDAPFPPDPRIRLLRPGRIGLVASLNLGLAAARSPLIARMDADDLMHPERLELQRRYLEDHPEIMLAASRVEIFPEELMGTGLREYVRWQDRCVTPEQIAANIFVEAPFVHPSVMFRREAVDGYRQGDFPEDYELWLRLHASGARMAKLPQALLRWRIGGQRATLVDPRYRRDAFDRLRGAWLARDPRLNSGRAVVAWGAGRRTRHRLRPLREHGIHPAAWIDIDPRKIGHTVEGSPVFAPQWLQRPEKPFVLVCVTSHGARDEVEQRLSGFGYEIGRDYLPVGI